MVINRNTLPVLYTVAMISGFSNLAVLANRPAPICNIERDDVGNPVRVIGTVDYSGFGSTLSLILSGITIAGAGTLLAKHLKGEEVEETINTPNPHSVLMPSSTPTFDSMTEGLSQVIPEEIIIDNSPSPILQDGPLTINLNKQEKKVDKPARNIVQEIASSHQSTVIVSEPGCGKSTLEKAVLATVLRTFEDVDIYIAGKKNDSWLGLAQNKDRFCFVTKDTLGDFVEMMEEVQNELTRRLGTPEEERDFDSKPLVLLLDDWHALCNSLTKENKEKVTNILGEILTTGREFFVIAHVLTQSFNIDSLGVKDSNLRKCMNMVACFKSNTDEKGRNDGGVGVAMNMISNSTIVDSRQKQYLSDLLPKFVKQTEQTGLPGFICLMGPSPYIGMLPDLNWVKGLKVRAILQPVKPTESNNIETEVDTEKAVEMLNRAVQIDTSDYDLYQYICDLAKEGKNQTYIIKEVLQKPGRNYQDGRAELRKLQDKYGDIPFKQN